MDRERLGRVLGRGARMAARTAIEAVDAATSPGPARPAPQTARPAAPEVIPPGSIPPQPQTATPVANIARAAASAKQGVTAPLKRASRALWHELTGSFFALFALSFILAVWKTRQSAVSAVPTDRYHFYTYCALAMLFAYFSVSSFLRARRA